MDNTGVTVPGSVRPITGVFHNVLLAGLGLITVVGQQSGRIVGALIQKGRRVEPKVADGLRRAGQEIGGAVGGVGRGVAGATTGWMPRGDGGTAKEVLEDRVEELTRTVEELASKIERMQSRGRRPRNGGSQ